MSDNILEDIRGVLLDIDGTLVDSNEYHADAWARAFHAHGEAVAKQAIREHIGKGADQLIPSLLPNASSGEQAAIAAEHDRIFKAEYLPRVQPFAGAADTVASLHRRGLRVVLASSASRAEVDHYIQLMNIQDSLLGSTCADDVKRSKPAGDLFAAALKKAGVPAALTLVVGDTPYDVIAASKCSIATVAVLSGGFPELQLRAAGARYIIHSVTVLAGSAVNT